MNISSMFKRKRIQGFDEIYFLEEISKRLIEGYSLERAILDIIKSSNNADLKKKLVYLFRGQGCSRVIRSLRFSTNLPLFIVDIVRVKTSFAGGVAQELVSILLLNRRYGRERSNLLGLLYHRCLIISSLLGLSLAFLSRISPILSSLYNLDFSEWIYLATPGIIQSSFILGLSASVLLMLLFGERKTILGAVLYLIFYYLGYLLSSPISSILHV